MCGIAGCVGHHEAVKFVTDSLDLMEARGYDTAGVAYLSDEPPGLEVIRASGLVANLVAAIPPEAASATTAIGHTRWGTHGRRGAVENAHPQTNSDGTIAVVHNGIIENHRDLKAQLQSDGYEFTSDTDTEVIPHLLDSYLREGLDHDEAFNRTVKDLRGAYAILGYFGTEPDAIYAARLGSNPLLFGLRGDEWFVASARNSIKQKTRWIDRIESNELARFSSDNSKYRTWHLDGRSIIKTLKEDTEKLDDSELGDFQHWMLKEIYDGPETVNEVLRGRMYTQVNGETKRKVRLGGLENPEVQERLKWADRIIIVSCGTSYHAGMIGQRLIEEVTGIPVEAELASEFLYRNRPLGRDTIVIGISQSGETADTLGALQKAKDNGLLTLGINNSPGSEMEAITDAGVHCRAGTERSVASTKAFISQVTVLAEIALALCKEQTPLYEALHAELCALPDKMRQIIDNQEVIEEVAKKYSQAKNFLYLGRGYEVASAKEGALKLKEISYIHAEAEAAGEMKHGPIAMIEEAFPTLAIATDGPVYEKMVSNIQEIKSSDGRVVALATEGNTEIAEIADDVIYVPKSLEQTQPILNAVALQLFAYYVAKELGTSIDRPRNLAKSVTVE